MEHARKSAVPGEGDAYDRFTGRDAPARRQHKAPAQRTSKATGSYWLLAVRAECPDAAAHAARAATRGLRQGTRDNRSGDSTCAPARTCKDVWRPGAWLDAQQRGLL